MKNDDNVVFVGYSNMENRSSQDYEGGGLGSLSSAYSNPALTASVTSVAGLPKTDLNGSNTFIIVDDQKLSIADNLRECVPWMKQKTRSACTKKMLQRRLPILNWLPKYNSNSAVGDLVAGITVGLTVIPQSLAYSNVAGLPAEYGLYGSFLGCIVYILFGSCKDVPMGPTAIASLLTFQAVSGHGPEHAILLCFLSGMIELLMGLFGLGFLIDFVSGPVSSGFTSAVALIIVSSQIKDVLGIKVVGATFLDMWTGIVENIGSTRLWDPILGVICIVILLLMRLLSSVKFGPTSSSAVEKSPSEGSDGVSFDKLSRFHQVLNKLIWLVATSRNAILVVIGGVIGYYFYEADTGRTPFVLIGSIPPGLPEVKAPSFGYYDTHTNETVTFFQMVSNLGSGIIVVPLIALLENIAICKAFADGKSVDATQELIAIGLSNIANSFVQGYPGTGSLSRSAVNNSSGVRTPLGGLYTGALVIVALLFFTPYFFFIPKCALAAIIIAAVIFMVEIKVVKPMWRSKKSDLIPGVGTFIACLLLPLEIGIAIGIGLNLLFILYHAARPKISIEKLTTTAGIEYLMLTPDRCLIFPSVDYVRHLVTKHSVRQQTLPVVIDCSHIYGADYTAATIIDILSKDFTSRGQLLFFYNLKPSVCKVFEGLSPSHFYVFYNESDLDRLLKDRCYKPKVMEIA